MSREDPQPEDEVLVELASAEETGGESIEAHGWIEEWDMEAGMARVRLEDDRVVEVTTGACELL